MKKSGTLRMALGAFAVAALLVTSGVVSAGAASGPKLTVTPSTNLKNGETVKVSGTGFRKGDFVYVVECLVGAKSGAQCNELSATPATINSKGEMPVTKFTVSTGSVGGGTCGTKPSNLKKCDVSVGNAQGTDSAVFPIVFK
ncbi:MAG: neocarzinostatin apoprotein domain-containing protein [Acidimicrobiales bacterium]